MEEKESYQTLVCNICWGTKVYNGAAKKISQDDLPAQISIDIPNAVLEQANKSTNNFDDVIEQFVYNLLFKKFGREVNRCQIWLPFE